MTPASATDDEKKLAISEFIRDEHGIKVVDAVRELLKIQFIEAIDEDYILELKQGIQEWNGCTLIDLLIHVRLNYVTMDDIVYNSITKSFAEPPDMDLPIDKYFTKQEECRLLASDLDNPITDVAMVLQLTTHMSATGIIKRSVTKFKRQGKPEKTWTKGKTWFRRDLKVITDEVKGSGIEPGYQANMGIKTLSLQDEARDEVAAGMRELFGQLAQAAVAKSDTIDAHAATIAALTKTIAELTATNAILAAALAAKGSRTITPPPGFNPTGAATANTTGHAVNSAGIACPTKKRFGRT